MIDQQNSTTSTVHPQWVRCDQDGVPVWGRAENGLIIIRSGSPFDPIHHDTQERLTLCDTCLLPPCTPSKIICVGRNYREHAHELGNEVPKQPLLFLKPSSSLLAHNRPIELPPESQQVDYEGELAVVIGRRCRRLGASEDVLPYIFGFTCANDVTARDLQKSDGQWSRAKGFDTFCPLGPWIVPPEPGNRQPWRGLRLETRVNDELRQQGNTDDMIFPVDVLLRAISACMTLEPGDVVLTGTPAGVGRLQHGDRVSVTISGIGTLENPVA